MRSPSLQGQTFGRLTVLSEAQQIGYERYWLCICKCGTQKTARQTDLKSGGTSSCGCFRKEVSRKKLFVHGLKDTKEYTSYRGMLNRCYQESHIGYKNYGGRGITVCARWRHDFLAFLNDMGFRPEGCSLDRIDVDGNYEPSNCRWASRQQQAENQRPKKKRITECAH
jgi:hypothetical protein